jgi:hypothetical protein
MKVADAPMTLLIDSGRCEVIILTAGVRIAMSAEEASALWDELGDSLRRIYREHPERCPPKFAVLLSTERDSPREAYANIRQLPLDQSLERIIAYAQRSHGAEDPNAAQAPTIRGADPELPAATSGVISRAIRTLTGR